MHLRITSGYSRVDGIEKLAGLLEKIPDFDTIVATGVSGAILSPVLAHILNKKLLIVRKPDVYSHAHIAAEGELGKSWVFVDDFICTGKSYKRCLYVVNRICKATNFTSTPVGTFEYNNEFFGKYSPLSSSHKLKEYELENFDEAYADINFGSNGIGVREVYPDGRINTPNMEISAPHLTPF